MYLLSNFPTMANIILMRRSSEHDEYMKNYFQNQAAPNAAHMIEQIMIRNREVCIGGMKFRISDPDAITNALQTLYRGGQNEEFPSPNWLHDLNEEYLLSKGTDPNCILSKKNIDAAMDEAESRLLRGECIEFNGEVFSTMEEVECRLNGEEHEARLFLKHLLTLCDHSSDSKSSHFRSG